MCIAFGHCPKHPTSWAKPQQICIKCCREHVQFRTHPLTKTTIVVPVSWLQAMFSVRKVASLHSSGGITPGFKAKDKPNVDDWSLHSCTIQRRVLLIILGERTLSLNCWVHHLLPADCMIYRIIHPPLDLHNEQRDHHTSLTLYTPSDSHSCTCLYQCIGNHGAADKLTSSRPCPKARKVQLSKYSRWPGSTPLATTLHLSRARMKPIERAH